MNDTFSPLSCDSSLIRLVQFRNVELSDIVNSICLKRFRNGSFTSEFYFSWIIDETVDSIACDTVKDKYEPFLVNSEIIMKLVKESPLSSLSQDRFFLACA
jgi:hypothetical protein